MLETIVTDHVGALCSLACARSAEHKDNTRILLAEKRLGALRSGQLSRLLFVGNDRHCFLLILMFASRLPVLDARVLLRVNGLGLKTLGFLAALGFALLDRVGEQTGACKENGQEGEKADSVAIAAGLSGRYRPVDDTLLAFGNGLGVGQAWGAVQQAKASTMADCA